jgi:hypothetical protein
VIQAFSLSCCASLRHAMTDARNHIAIKYSIGVHPIDATRRSSDAPPEGRDV